MNNNDAPHPFVGMWVTADGFIRQELLATGRYDEARGNTRSAYTGSYTVVGNHIDYRDDTGFTATGDIHERRPAPRTPDPPPRGPHHPSPRPAGCLTVRGSSVVGADRG
ncbi:hypothetical protein ABIA38_003715 [Embleya sp. AB8]